MLQHASPSEASELLEEFGGPQEGNRCERVTRKFYFERAAGQNNVTSEVTQSPTRAKPLLVLAWVRMTLERGVNEGLLRPQQLTSFSSGMTELVRALGGVAKVDTMVLPFPYVQLLRWSLLIFCFTLPFVMATELQWWNIPLCMVTTCAFYGLDEIGCELEQPFGVDPNDYKLIEMGNELARDLDALLRTANKQRVKARHDPVATRRSFDTGEMASEASDKDPTLGVRLDRGVSHGALGTATQSSPQVEVPVAILSDSI